MRAEPVSGAWAGFVLVGRLDATVSSGNEFSRMSQAAGGRISRFSIIADDANHGNRFKDAQGHRDDSAHGNYEAGANLKAADIEHGTRARDDSAHGKHDSISK